MEQKHRIFLSHAELMEFIQDHVTEYPVYMVEIYPRGSYYDLYGSNDCKKWFLASSKIPFSL